MQTVTRVNIKLLELEVEGLRRKLKLHKKITNERTAFIESLDSIPPDPQQKHLSTIANEKRQLIWETQLTLTKNRKALNDLHENLKRFKEDSHLKSITQCGEIIFEMRKIRAHYNVYMNFKKNLKSFQAKLVTLEEENENKKADFEEHIQKCKRLAKEHETDIGKKIKETLFEEALQMNQDALKKYKLFLWAVKDNSELTNFISTAVHLNDIRQTANVTDRKISLDVLEKIKQISDFQDEIERTTKEITKLKNRIKSIVDRNFENQAKPRIGQQKWKKNKSEFPYDIEACMRNEIDQMKNAKENIFNLATMITRFDDNSETILKSKEGLFKEYELQNFLNNILDMALEPSASNRDNEEFRHQAAIMEEETVYKDIDDISFQHGFDRESTYYSSEKFTLRSETTSSIALKYLPKTSGVIDVEQDPEELTYFYETLKEKEEETLDDMLENEDMSVPSSFNV